MAISNTDNLSTGKIDPLLFESIIKQTLKDNFRGVSSKYPNKRLYYELSDPDNFVQKTWKDYKGPIILYAHIPFCAHREPPKNISREIWSTNDCGFCDFFKTEISKSYKLSDLVLGLKKEIQLYKQFLFKDNCTLEGIFFGGGTPSLLSPEQYSLIFEPLRSTFGEISNNIEICIEISPETIPQHEISGRERLQKYFEVGFNRVSFGIQTFNPKELKLIPRRSSPTDAEHLENVVRWAKEMGFRNINIDLIVGLPGQNKKSLLNTLKKSINLNVPTISIYTYQTRKNTNFYWCEKYKVIDFLKSSEITKLYNIAKQQLKNADYKQAFSSIWKKGENGGSNQEDNLHKFVPELGIGPGANTKGPHAEYTCGYGYNSVSNLQRILNWSSKLKNNNFPATHGFEMNKDEERRKYVSWKLATPQGIDTKDYILRFKKHPLRHFPEQFKALGRHKLIDISESNIKFNSMGYDFQRPLLTIFFSQKTMGLYKEKINYRLT